MPVFYSRLFPQVAWVWEHWDQAPAAVEHPDLGVGAPLGSGSCSSGAPSSAETSKYLSSKENLHLHLKHEFLMYIL